MHYLNVSVLILFSAISTVFCQIDHATAEDGPKVVVSIAPLHSLATGLMAKDNPPHLLVKNGTSPHTYALRPSDATALQQADLIFWVGKSLETFLAKPLKNKTGKGLITTLHKADGIKILANRGSGDWGHESLSDHDDHDHHDHGAEEGDMHLWLDPFNAKVIVGVMADALITADQKNREIYIKRKNRLFDQLYSLDMELEKKLAPFRDVPFMVFHDGFQYFERRYRLNAVGAITPSAQKSPGARRIDRVEKILEKSQIHCLFQEPQFSSAIVKAVIGKKNVEIGLLDPMGSGFNPGADHYFRTMVAIADSLADCLSTKK
ncbi:MAG: zinc ABC transporter substrate-binding protein [Magnetococcales bacterium]|nr:zinc ABC transporter substrate-binding protein [Magnetococcales bacterium]